MNYKNKNTLRKEIKGLFSASYPEGCSKWTNETIEHYTTKCQVLAWFKSQGYSVWTECSFKDYGRCDLIVQKGTICYIIEILKSEKEVSFLKKIDKYPDIMVIPIKVGDWDYNKFKL